MYRFKKLMPIRLKKMLVSLLRKEDVQLPKTKLAFVFLAADYGNIGDLAITAAQASFMANQLKGYTVVRVPISRTRTQLSSIKNQIKPSDLVSIIGGGNMGSLYPDIEELRQLVIRSFPRNRVVCFPQTLDWDESAVSNRALKNIVKVYSSHPDIHVLARESVTRDKLILMFRTHSNVSIGYTPDIVLSATGIMLGAKPEKSPSGILLCLRNDGERALDPGHHAQLDEVLAGIDEFVEVTDTHAGGSRLDESYCAGLLSNKLSQFSNARLVITDRLHGMILSVLAGTPCLVFPNTNQKIRQTWRNWLSEHPLVAFLEPEQFESLPKVLEQLLTIPRGNLDVPPMRVEHYADLKEALTRR